MKFLVLFLMVFSCECFAGCGDDSSVLEAQYLHGTWEGRSDELIVGLECVNRRHAAFSALILDEINIRSGRVKEVLVEAANGSLGFWASRAAVDTLCLSYKDSSSVVVGDYLFNNLKVRVGDELVSILGGYLSCEIKDKRAVDYILMNGSRFSNFQERSMASMVLRYMNGEAEIID